MRRAGKRHPAIIWNKTKPEESRGPGHPSDPEISLWDIWDVENEGRARSKRARPSSIIVEPSFLQALRHPEMMLQRGQRLAGPILQVGIVATL